MGEQPYIYHRALTSDGQDSLAKIARRIAPGTRVLDIGCGPGVLGDYLTRERGCVVDGVESNPEAARFAAQCYRSVAVADLEVHAFDASEGPYDYIVCADVLEHVRDPSAVMRRLSPLLAKSGRLILSIPNVAYAGLIAGLMNGEFRYRFKGLLDETHLRFFTRRSLHEWIQAMGLHVLDIDIVRLDVVDSEFAHEGLESFAPALKQQLLSFEDALTYQFIVEVGAAPAERQPAIPDEGPPAAVTYLSQLYWRTGTAEFDEARSAFARPRLAADPQRVRFPLPPLPGTDVALRLDVADRPGYLRLYDVSVYDAEGSCVWKWDPRRDPADTMRSYDLAFVDDEAHGQLMVALANNPCLELPFAPPHANALARGGYVEAVLSWPSSTDSIAVIKQLARTEARDGLFREVSRARSELHRLRGALASAEDALASANSARRDLAEQVAGLRAVVQQINESITFRIASPLFGVANRLRQLRKSQR